MTIIGLTSKGLTSILGIALIIFSSVVSASNTKVETHFEKKIQPPFVGLKKDIPIGAVDGVTLKIDVALPAVRSDTPSPVIVMIHGGGFIKGDKSKFSNMLQRFSDNGIVAASIMYRFAPKYKFPTQIEDAKAAIRFLKAHALEYNLDPDRIVVNGSSAGGYIAIMLGVTGNSDVFSDLGLYPNQNATVKAVIAGSTAPVDFSLPEFKDFYVIKRLIDEDQYDNNTVLKSLSPTTYLDADDPHFFLSHGTADELVPIEMMRSFTTVLDQMNHPYSYMEVEGGGHSLTSTQPAEAKKVFEASMDFFKKQTGRDRTPNAGHPFK